MKTTRNFLTVAALALAACAGAVFAGQTDVAAAITALFHLPEGLLAGAALAWGPLVRDLQGKHAAAVDSAKAILAKAEAEDRDMTDDEKTAFAEHQAKATSLKNRIDTAQAMELAEAGVQAQGPAAPVGRGEGAVNLAANARIGAVQENIEHDPNRGFRALGEFARAVVNASVGARTGAPMDPRLGSLWNAPQAAAPGTYTGEGAGADGAFLIPPGFSTDIFTLSLTEDSLLGLCDDVKVDGNTMSFPRDETTPWGTDGVRAYWQGEAQSGTPSKVALGLDAFRLKKLLALTPVSDEMLSDSSALATYLPGKMADSIRWKTNEALLFGQGGPTPLGALSSNAAITQAKDGGQATNTLSAQNLANMMGRLLPGSFPRAMWIINNDVLSKLVTLTLGNFPIYMAPGSPQSPIGQAPYGMLLGRPIMVSQHANTFSSQGDVLLVDMKGYRTITKSEGITTATSMHLYFDADAMAFRTTFRVDGAPKASKPVTPAKGSTTLSHFVQLEAR